MLFRCPVCNSSLADLGPPSEQEFHVKNCLDGGSGTPQAAKYLVYKLPAESALVGIECVICLEEFAKGMLYAHTVSSIYLVSFVQARWWLASAACAVSTMVCYTLKNLGPVSFIFVYSLPIILVAAWKELPCPCSLIHVHASSSLSFPYSPPAPHRIVMLHIICNGRLLAPYLDQEKLNQSFSRGS
jgi:hypothetical protein